MFRGEAFHRSDFGVPKTVPKRGRNLNSLQPRVLKLHGSLEGDKSTIDDLLERHYGNNLELKFYKIIDGRNSPGDNVKEGSQEAYEYEDEAAAMMV
nr:unnamed protein product [Callosobruchus chinensis]